MGFFQRNLYPLAIGLVAAVSFMPFLGGIHLFDWDEINFAECAREMILLGEYLRVHIEYLPFWEKPPLFIWFQAASMHLWGIGEYAARFPNAVCGVATLVVIFNIGKKIYNEKFGLLWALAYFGSVLPNFYFRSGIIDPWFNFFIFLGIYYFALFYWRKEQYLGIGLPRSAWWYLLAAGFWLGLAILTKGPTAYLIVGLCLFVYWVMHRFRLYISPWQFVVFSMAAVALTALWYGIETYKNGPWFVTEFVKYQYRLFSTPDAGHEGFLGYHFVVLLLGCFPASVFCLRAFAYQEQEFAYQRNFKLWMLILFWVVLILFSIVKSKIVHYSSLCYFPLTYLAALTVWQIMEGKIRFAVWMRALLVFIAVLVAAVLVAVPLAAQRLDLIRPLLANDPFAQANLDAQVHWFGWEALSGVVFLAAVLWGVVRIARQPAQLHGFVGLFGGTALAVLLAMYLYMPKIEPYTQGAALEFFEKAVGQECYVYTYGYRSYAHLFYSKLKPSGKPLKPPGEAWEQYLFYGPVDKDVYISCKIFDEVRLDSVSTLQKQYAKNGFVFYKRPRVR